MKNFGVYPRATTKVLTGTGTSTPPIYTRIQEIVSSRGSIGPQKVRNAHSFKISINKFSTEHGHPMPILSNTINRKTVADESADVNYCYRMDFGRNYFVTKSPNFMDFRLSPANTPDKIKSVIIPTTRVGRLTNGSNWLRPRHDIEEVTTNRVSEKKRTATTFKKMSLKLWKKFNILNGKIFLWLDQLWNPFHHCKMENSNSPFHHQKMENSNSPFHHRKMEKSITISPQQNGKDDPDPEPSF